MQDNTIENKVKVFISSKCSGRYTVVRKALKALLLETNMTIIYTFETSGASSQPVVNSYINELDDSDLCIFLIDNADGISDPVMAEHKRARELGKKSIYIFCDEKQKEPTQLQTEIIGSQKERIAVVHEFSDFVEKAYKDAIRDITNIYRIYCRGQLKDKSEVAETDSVLKFIDIYKLDKSLFKGFDLTKNELIKIIYPLKNEIKDTSELDELCKILLRVVSGNERPDSIDFTSLRNYLCEIHEEYLKDFISLRVNAIKAYFNNDLEKCYSELRTMHEKTIDYAKIPNWLLNDLLIDMRNIEYLINQMKNQFTLKSIGQELLDKNNEPVYYPLLDRYDGNFREGVIQKCLSSKTDSPYTISFGGLEIVFKNIASAFIVAVMYGSLTQILITRERLIETLSIYCFIYRDHSIYVELLKLLLICQKDKEIEKIIRAYNQTTDIINENDIDYLLGGINNIPLDQERLISKFILVKHFGYYFSEKQYNPISNELMVEIERWVNNDNRIFALSSIIFKALTNNIDRMNNNKVLSIIITVFEKELERWYDDALEVIGVINLSTISEMMKIKTIDILISLVTNKEKRDKCGNLQNTLLYVRKNINTKTDILDNCIKNHMVKFYHNDYSLECFKGEVKDTLKHITRFLQIIHQQNQEQGKNGKYRVYSSNPYQTIRNIIEYEKLHLDWEDIEPIINAIDSTVFAPNQTIGAKISAIQLLIYLRNKSWADDELNKTFERFVVHKEEIICGYEEFLLKDSLNTLKFNFLILKVCFGKYDIYELLTNIAIYVQQNDYEIIKSLQCIDTLLYNMDFEYMEDRILSVIAQYVISMGSHDEKEIRYYSAKIMLSLCRSNIKSSALLQLSKMMDKDVHLIKKMILKNINTIPNNNDEIIKYIKQKGRVDNHFLIRNIAKDISM